MRRKPSTPREVPAVIWVPKRKRRNRRGKRRSRIPEAPYPTQLPIPRRSESSHPRNATPSGSRFLQEPPRNPAVPQQKQQDIRRATELPPACQGPARSLDEAARRRCHFWDTQPVPKLNALVTVTSQGATEADKNGMRQESFSLPQGLMGDTLDLGNADMLSENYVEDEASTFHRDYWPKFLLCVKKMVEINFLCACKELRSKWANPVWILEITRNVNPEGFQAVYTAVVLPQPMAMCRSWRRSLNPRKLVKVQFPHVSRHLTLQRTTGPYRLPEKGFDVFNALDLMENKTFLETLKLGIGDGDSQYHAHSWACPGAESEKVGLVSQ